MEKWLPAPGLNGIAEVSDLGRVRTLDRDCPVPRRVRNGNAQAPTVQRRKGQVLADEVGRNGYRYVSIKMGDRRPKFLVHRLVCEAFNGKPFDGAHCDHLDCDKLNNAPENLEWVTPAENTRRQWRNGLVDLRGEGQPGSKLTKEQAAAVKVLGEAGFPELLIGEWFGVSQGTVSAIKAGRRWKNTLA